MRRGRMHVPHTAAREPCPLTFTRAWPNSLPTLQHRSYDLSRNPYVLCQRRLCTQHMRAVLMKCQGKGGGDQPSVKGGSKALKTHSGGGGAKDAAASPASRPPQPPPASLSPPASSPPTQAPPPTISHLKLDLPPPIHSRVKTATFVKSSPNVAACPPDKHPEIALIGRSNVGKSSLINTLCEQVKMAKVSKEPGMTKLINHYLVNEAISPWYLVDLPGYGFAKTASKEAREGWLDYTKDFFINRDNLVHVLLLVDASLPPQQVDLDCADWLAECEVPFAIVFTKIDSDKKGSATNCVRNIRTFKEGLAKAWEELPWCFATSSKTGAGRSELLQYLASLRELHLASTSTSTTSSTRGRRGGGAPAKASSSP